MIRVLVVDDHSLMREGLKQIIDHVADMEVVAEAGTGPEALASFKSSPCDVVLLDIAMPGRSGLDVLKQLKSDSPRVAVLMLSMYPESEYAVRCLKAGASGYLTKESVSEELVRAIRVVAQGRKYVSQSLAERLATVLGDDADRPPHEALSDREYQVLCLLARGRTPTQVADELSLSVKTISTYRTRILAKLRLETSAQLVHYAIRNRLVQ